MSLDLGNFFIYEHLCVQYKFFYVISIIFGIAVILLSVISHKQFLVGHYAPLSIVGNYGC